MANLEENKNEKKIQNNLSLGNVVGTQIKI